ncbi:unnamed protein product [Darwinula stevensoni]|uniref:Uncharacterized protein n=1 Tax=Darwinula stevensoni TaxID=69355 RepID=A0A7R8XD00_9CRUS|nr:unnamed protein product [Darwinula stevensoni]CAG0893829.1 unnamed protein product [Darwinula stevensoni]
MEVASTDAAPVKPNYNFALALFIEKERRKTFNVVPAIAGYVNVSELVRGCNIMDIPYENSLNPDDINTKKEGKEMIGALNRRSPTNSFKSDASSELIVDEDEVSHHSSVEFEQGGEK